MTQKSETSLAGSVMKLASIFALMVIPTLVSIFIAMEVKNVRTLTAAAIKKDEPQIVCFENNVCAIEVHNKWYRISGIILMEETVPEEYKLNDLIEESSQTQKNTVASDPPPKYKDRNVND